LQAPAASVRWISATPAAAQSAATAAPPAPASAGGVSPGSPVAVFVKREGKSGFAKVLADPARSVGWLVDAVKAKLEITACPTDISLHALAVDGATHGPALDATATVTEALGDPVPRKIRLVVKVAQLVRFRPPPLPATVPVKPFPAAHGFTCVGVVPSVTGPVFVPAGARDRFMQCVKPSQDALGCAIMLAGPQKCGKSMVLRHLVPSWVADHYRHNGDRGPTPVFCIFEFDRGADPNVAAVAMVSSIATQLARMGMDDIAWFALAPGPDAASNLRHVLSSMACRLRSHGYKLWLLLDEIQASRDRT
jgi:hypothetical protein